MTPNLDPCEQCRCATRLSAEQAANLVRVYRWDGLPCRVSGAQVVVETEEVSAVLVPHALSELLRGRLDMPIINDYRCGRIAIAAHGEDDDIHHDFLARAGCTPLPSGMTLLVPVLDHVDGSYPDWFQRPHRNLCPLETLARAIQLALKPALPQPPTLLRVAEPDVHCCGN